MVQDYLQRLLTIDRLARIKGTGTPKQLAQRLNISERSLYRLIDIMRSFGAPLDYCRSRGSYYYKESGEFCIKFLTDPINE